MSLAKVNGVFRLTRDAELKYLSNGTAVIKMGVACSEKFGEKETQLFLDATAFGKPAEILNTYAGAKGTQIFLSGKLQTESWEKDGQKHSKVLMIIEGFDLIGSKQEATPKQAPQQQPNYNSPQGYSQQPQQDHRAYKEQPQRQMPPPPQGLYVDEDTLPF